MEPEEVNEIIPVVTYETRKGYRWVYQTRERVVKMKKYHWINTKKVDWISAKIFMKSPKKVI